MTPVGALLAARYPSKFPAWHRDVYRKTGGLVGHRWTGYPCLLLTTTGRRSGERRDTVLTYVELDGLPLIAGSNGGADRPPAWLLNLRADPSAEVRVGRRRFRARAVELPTDSAEHAQGWADLNELRGGRYRMYQDSTDRPIPLIHLVPVDGTAPGKTHAT